MSFKIGGFFGGHNQISNNTTNAPLVATSQTSSKYEGGSLTVTIKSADTQQKFVWRGLYEHAKAAGLDDAEAKKFANAWVKPNTSFNHRANGQNEPYTDAEFNQLKKQGTTRFELNNEFDAHILADLNQRVEDNAPIQAQTAWAEMTPENRAKLQQQNSKSASANQAAIQDKPIKTIVNAKTEDGKPLTENQALSRYIERNYNQDKRVWGDKINEMIAQAKLGGVKVEVQTSDDGQTALVGVSASDKQKLDRLFNQALGETIKGEGASDEGKREATRMFGDIPRTGWNSIVKAGEYIANTPSDLEDIAMSARTPGSWATAKIGGIPEVDAQIPKLPDPPPLTEKDKIVPRVDLSAAELANQSEMFNRDITGKVNPDGQTMGKTVAQVTGAAIPFAFGKIIPSVNPNELTLIAPLQRPINGISAAKIGIVNAHTELDPLVAKQFGQIISDNPVATRAYAQMQKFGTEVKLDFGAPPEQGLFGQHFRFKNQTEIYMQNNGDARTAVSTMTHESSHVNSLIKGRSFGTQYDEFRAFTREFIFKEGRRPTLQEKRQIWLQVQRNYSDRPIERNPFEGRK